MSSPTRRQVLKTAAAAAAIAALPRTPFAAETTGKRFIVNDASRLNPTPVYRHWIVGTDEQSVFIEHLRRELKDAAAAKRPVAVAAARHTMGGQSIPRDGTAITMQTFRCEPDTRAKTYLTDAGTRWHQVIATIDPLGFSPAVMQSNADFGVASTFCVNAHGWPVPYGPFGSTVRAFKLMLADGTILACSRTENSELFGLAMGGYGYFGIILELEVDMVPNVLLKPTFEAMPAEVFARKFTEAIDGDTGVKMAYGRLNVDRARFFREALMITYRALPTPEDGLPKAATSGSLSAISRDLYRAQVGSELVKRVRWFAETVAGPAVSSGIATRNSLMNEPVSNLAERRPQPHRHPARVLRAGGPLPGIPRGLPRDHPGEDDRVPQRHPALRGSGRDERHGLRAPAPHRRRHVVLAGGHAGGRSRNAAAHRGDDRPHDRHRRVLLPALSAARAARPGRARLSQHRPLRGEEAALRSGPSVPQRHVAGVFRALVSFIAWDEPTMDRTQKIALGFAVVLAAVTALGFIPGLTDAEGRTFGIFKLNLFNDILHSSSALWALIAGLMSKRAAVAFLKIFGTLYFLDGAMGVAFGSGFLDLGIIRNGILDWPLSFKILASAPHLILGGVAMFSGFVLGKD